MIKPVKVQHDRGGAFETPPLAEEQWMTAKVRERFSQPLVVCLCFHGSPYISVHSSNTTWTQWVKKKMPRTCGGGSSGKGWRERSGMSRYDQSILHTCTKFSEKKKTMTGLERWLSSGDSCSSKGPEFNSHHLTTTYNSIFKRSDALFWHFTSFTRGHTIG